MFQRHLLTASLLTLCLYSQWVSAGGIGSGGGDPDAIEFLRLADQLYLWLMKLNPDSPVKQDVDLELLRQNLDQLQQSTYGFTTETPNSKKKISKEPKQNASQPNSSNTFKLDFQSSTINCFGQEKPACTDATTGVRVNRIEWKLANSSKKCETVLLEMQLLGSKTNDRYASVSDPNRRSLIGAPCATNLSEVLQLEVEWLSSQIFDHLNAHFEILPDADGHLSITEDIDNLLKALLRKIPFNGTFQARRAPLRRGNSTEVVSKIYGAIVIDRHFFQVAQSVYESNFFKPDARSQFIDFVKDRVIFRDDFLRLVQYINRYQYDLYAFQRSIVSAPVVDQEGFLKRHQSIMDNSLIFIAHFGKLNDGTIDLAKFWSWNLESQQREADLGLPDSFIPFIKDVSEISLMRLVDFKTLFKGN